MNIEFRKVTSKDNIKTLADLANSVWHEYFPCILSDSQIDYMVDKFQSVHAITEQTEKNSYEYYFICDGDKYAGYIGLVREEEKMFLSKLYILKPYRGNGIASLALQFLKEQCIASKLGAIYLTVNRHNAHTIAVYEKMGFKLVREQCSDIGEGYVMDDYVMELSLL